MKKIILAVLFILIVGFGVSAQAQETEKSWDFEKWLVEIQINEDSTFVVKETQTFNFSGNFHWIQRDIAKERLRRITDVAVFDETGRQLGGNEVEIWEDASQVSVKLNFDLTDTQKTWSFQYKVWGGLGFFEDQDELYWNAVSSDRDVPIAEVEVYAYLPKPAELSQMQQLLFVGAYGSDETSANYAVLDNKTFKFWGQDIQPYENFTIVAGWPKGIISHGGLVKVTSEPNAKIYVDGQYSGLGTPAVLEQDLDITPGRHRVTVKRFGYEIAGQESYDVEVVKNNIAEISFEMEKTGWFKIMNYLPLVIPLLLLGYVVKKWKERPKIDKTIIAQYDPPDNLPPAEVAALVTTQLRPRAVTAMMIDLAYRGYMKIIEKEEKRWFGTSKKYSFEKTKRSKSGDVLKDYEAELMDAIFGANDKADMDEFKKPSRKSTLISAFRSIQSDVQGKLTNLDYFRKKPTQTATVLMIILAFLSFFFGFVTLSLIAHILLGPALIISAAILFVGAVILPQPLSEKGLEAKWHALGFREYLRVAERFRLGACTPETFEKYLSYAIVFGVEDKWADRFADIYKEPPEWYESSAPVSAFNVAAFTSGISSMNSAVSTSVTYSGSSASGSSGFGGGGSAGGGGGGGGSSAG